MKLKNKNLNLFSLLIKPAVILFLMSFFFAACNRKLYKDKFSEEDIETGSVYLREYYNWDLMKSRKIFTKFIIESADPNLFDLYKKYDFDMLWINRGNLNDNAKQLINSLRASWKEGLSNEEYNISQIYEYISDLQGKKKINHRTMKKYIHLDLLFSLAYLDYASDLLSGRINPNALDSVWEAHPREYELLEIMEIALETGTVTHSLNELKPENPQYSRLSAWLKDYLIIRDKGGWKQPGYFPLLKIGDSNPNLIAIKNYLRTTGDLEFADSAYMISEIFDEKLKKAVINFQLRHGLKTDGIIGRMTLREMNKPVEYRIDQIKVNMERLRWLPEKFGEKYILLNLPEFKLRYYEKGYLLKEMKIVIGEIEKYTPVLKDTLKYIVFNPSWNLPRSIAVEEKLPKIKSDSTYLE
ncbi:MAG: peptidoglycan-binding protein, partial [bacterium]